MGLEFFQRVVELQKKYTKPHQTIENDLQTNGTLLDEDWCTFLKNNNFLVGLSIDGPADLHDIHRYNKGGKPTHGKVMHAVALLHHYQIPFNALCVVNRDNSKRPLEVYRFTRSSTTTHDPIYSGYGKRAVPANRTWILELERPPEARQFSSATGDSRFGGY